MSETASQELPHTLLSIIIPEYEPDIPRLAQNLSTIQNQINVDLHQILIILINDSDGKPLTREWLEQFHGLNIVYASTDKNGGPGIARQAGIDLSRSEYVMFIDADDRLYSPLTLSLICNELRNQLAQQPTNKWDIMLTNWIEEAASANTFDAQHNMRPDQFVYAPHDNDGTWMHGKIYRRQFLVDNNIRFNELRVHEDRRFNMMALALSNRTVTLATQERTYLWTYNPQSIVRRDNAAYSYNSMDIAIQAADQAYSFLIANHADRMDSHCFDQNKLNSEHKFNLVRDIAQNVFYMYFIDQAWTGKVDQKWMDSLEKALSAFYSKYINYYNLLQGNDLNNAYGTERTVAGTQTAGFIEQEGLTPFLKRITAKYPYDGEVLEVK